MDDREIIQLYHSRDETAITQTAHKYGAYCLAIADRILYDTQTAEECVSDTYLRAWGTMPPAWPECLRLFLARIVRNCALSRLRAQSREKRGGGTVPLALEELIDLAGSLPEPSQALEQTLLAEAINRFLRTLPDRECGIFVHRYFYLEATPQIARRWGISEGNVLRILSRIRRKLKTHLETEGFSV